MKSSQKLLATQSLKKAEKGKKVFGQQNTFSKKGGTLSCYQMETSMKAQPERDGEKNQGLNLYFVERNKSEILRAFSFNLNKRLYNHDMDVADLARILNVPKPRAYAWVRGVCFPSMNHILAICDLFEIQDIRVLVTKQL